MKTFPGGLMCRISMVLQALLLLSAAGMAETQQWQDDFERSSKQTGEPLHKQSVGKSDAAWEATPNLVFADISGLQVKDKGPLMGRVGLPLDAKKIEVEVELHPVPIEGGDGWLAVGMGSATLGNPTFGGLYLIVYPKGNFVLLFNPDSADDRSKSAVSMKSGRILNFNPDGMNRIKLALDRENDSVQAWVNGDVLFDALSLKDKNFTLDPAYAGFSGYGQSSEARIIGTFSASVVQ